KNIRPERPCGVASVASQVGITCSPIAAAVVAFVTISNANGYMVSIPQVLMVTIPACVIGLMCAAAASYKRGKDLDKDPEFLARKADPKIYKYMYVNKTSLLDKEIPRSAKVSVFIFLAAILVIVGFAFCQMIKVGGEPLSKLINLPKMNICIQIIMLVAAALNIMLCKVDLKNCVSGSVWKSGMVAVIAIYGIAWLADTYFGNYMDQMKAMLTDLVTAYPWSIAFVFFLVSVLINSQGAVVVAMLPLAYELGIAGPVLLGVLPSVYGYFFIPNYPSDIATVNFDRSGTTVIGKYLLNHSFMMPGLISVWVSTVVGYLITNVFFPGYFASFIQ
ncbi:MAG: C4-dicarboxylate ABC transporter, partial [Bacteroidales bacterium]|nr:C4-dicarboxylate ABC transporter [Bacteroidales bacterium]